MKYRVSNSNSNKRRKYLGGKASSKQFLFQCGRNKNSGEIVENIRGANQSKDNEVLGFETFLRFFLGFSDV